MTDTLWFTRCPSPTAASIAIRQGWLEAEFCTDGVGVRSLASASDKSVHLSHYRHTQPNSFRFGGYVPPLVAASRGADLKIIGLAWPDREAGVYALPASGLHRPEDLKGRRLAVPRRLNDSIDWWRATVLDGYHQALRIGGLTAADVQFVDVDIEREYVADAAQGDRPDLSLWGAKSQFAVQREEVAALICGRVDVVYSDAALAALLTAFLGVTKVVDLRSSEHRPLGDAGHPVVLTVSGALIEDRPDWVARWIASLLQANRWAAGHREEARRIIAQDTGLPEDFVESAYSPDVYRQLDVSMSAPRVALLQARCDQLLRDNFIEQPIALSTLIDPRPLDEAHRLYTASVASCVEA